MKNNGIELPEKIVLNHYVDMETLQKQIYENYRQNISHDIVLDGNARVDNAENILKLLMRLVQCVSNPVLVDESYL